MEPTPNMVAALLDLLKALGITQRTVATQLKLTPGVVTQWRSGFRPIPQSHYEALSMLMQRTLDNAVDAADWPTRRTRVKKALRTYHHSILNTIERLAPGRGLRSLYADTEKYGRTISELMARGAASWTFMDRLILGITARQLDETLLLINLLQPIEKHVMEEQEEGPYAENTDPTNPV
jgi:transcriptional regulator with XRE-family HTH domain